jgi:hypothetical protein
VYGGESNDFLKEVAFQLPRMGETTPFDRICRRRFDFAVFRDKPNVEVEDRCRTDRNLPDRCELSDVDRTIPSRHGFRRPAQQDEHL